MKTPQVATEKKAAPVATKTKTPPVATEKQVAPVTVNKQTRNNKIATPEESPQRHTQHANATASPQNNDTRTKAQRVTKEQQTPHGAPVASRCRSDTAHTPKVRTQAMTESSVFSLDGMIASTRARHALQQETKSSNESAASPATEAGHTAAAPVPDAMAPSGTAKTEASSAMAPRTEWSYLAGLKVGSHVKVTASEAGVPVDMVISGHEGMVPLLRGQNRPERPLTEAAFLVALKQGRRFVA
jgi:hypothetical protein